MEPNSEINHFPTSGTCIRSVYVTSVCTCVTPEEALMDITNTSMDRWFLRLFLQLSVTQVGLSLKL